MILPTKHLTLEKSALGTAARVLSCLRERSTVSEVWSLASVGTRIESFDQFVAGLDLLYVMGVVRYENGWLVRRRDP